MNDRINDRMPFFDSNRGYNLVSTDDFERVKSDNRTKKGACCLNPVTKRTDFVIPSKDYGKLLDEGQMKNYLSLLRNHSNQFCLGNPKKSQFISFRRIEAEFVNELGTKIYNNHDIKEGRKFKFEVGDKIMVGKNADVALWLSLIHI